jgi:hypothetical protein
LSAKKKLTKAFDDLASIAGSLLSFSKPTGLQLIARNA